MSAKTFASSGFELSMVKKSGLVLLTRPLFMKILPQFYQTHYTATDSGSIHRSFLLLALIEQHKLVCLENLANAFLSALNLQVAAQNQRF